MAAGAVVAVLAGLGVAACAGEPVPRPSTVGPTAVGPEASPTGVTPSASPEPEPVASPAAPDLSEVGPETAAALAVYFVQLYPYVYATGDLTAWTELSHPECVFCASVVDDVEEMDRIRVIGGAVEVLESPRVTEVTSSRWFSVVFMIQEAVNQRVDSGGIPAGPKDPGGAYVMSVVILREDNEWRVRAVQVEQADSE